MSTKWLRRLAYIFKSRNLLGGLDHLLAMFPSTILAPIIINNQVGFELLDLSLVIFASGMGTIVFYIFSRGKIPVYLGSAFTYVGLTLYLLRDTNDTQMAFAYVGWSYIFAGFILMVLSMLYLSKRAPKVMASLLPPSIIGPSISLIGLELSGVAISDAGFDLTNYQHDKVAIVFALSTLALIIILSVVNNRVIRKAPILFGIVISFLVYGLIFDFPAIDTSTIIKPLRIRSPIVVFPKDVLKLILAVFPPTLLIFSQNFSRIAVINQLRYPEREIYSPENIKDYRRAAFSQGVSVVTNACIGSIPNAIYAENIAVLSISKEPEFLEEIDSKLNSITGKYSIVPFCFAAFYAIAFSQIWPLHQLLVSIPKPIIGGVELFVFSLIAAPGLLQIVDSKVDYRKISNQFLSASVFIAGISGLSISFPIVELTGMSLGLVVGIGVNMFFKALSYIGILNEQKSMQDLLRVCINDSLHESIRSLELSEGNASNLKNIDCTALISLLNNEMQSITIDSTVYNKDIINEYLNSARRIQIDYNKQKYTTILKTQTHMEILVDRGFINNDAKRRVCNDYKSIIQLSENDELRIDASRATTSKLRRIIKLIYDEHVKTM